MTPDTARKISKLRCLGEIEGWRKCVSDTRSFEDGEQAALVMREKQILEGQA